MAEIKENLMGEFCGSLFTLADKVKLAHLAVKGPGAYAKHVALGDLYDSVAGMADDITETIQGYKGILKISIPYANLVDIIPFLKGERNRIIGFLKYVDSMPDVGNKLQDLIGSISKTIYKLENLQ